MGKKFSGVSQTMSRFRGWIQAGATLLTNLHLPNFLKGGLYQGAGKTVCVPGLNCYSCPAASGACPIGAFQAVVGSSKFSFSYYITGFLILLGVLLGRFICGFLCPFGWFQELLHKIPTKKFSTKKLKPLRYLKYAVLLVMVFLLPAFLVNDVGMGDPFFCKYLCPQGVLEGANRLFNFLLFLFPYYLKTAMRKGVFKQYIRRRYNDGNVRGAIDIARHIERNTPFTGSVAYSQREFSYDNYLTELVRHTIEFIKRKPYGNNLLIKVKDEVKLIVDATPSYERYDCQKIIEANKKKAVRHAYFREYLALQRLCLLILQHQKHQIGAGSKQIYGILFDGAWLWEEYIGSLVDNVFYHPMNKAGKGAQRLFGGNIGLIYPDFISRDHETRVIADAKYKPLDNIGNKDYLQVLAYMLRFDAKKGYYLYPEAEGADDLQLWLNKGSTYEANVVPRDDICIIKHGLKIPIDAENYESFVSKMQVSESEFRQVFIG